MSRVLVRNRCCLSLARGATLHRTLTRSSCWGCSVIRSALGSVISRRASLRLSYSTGWRVNLIQLWSWLCTSSVDSWVGGVSARSRGLFNSELGLKLKLAYLLRPSSIAGLLVNAARSVARTLVLVLMNIRINSANATYRVRRCHFSWFLTVHYGDVINRWEWVYNFSIR